jgi:hypothetical protein
MNIGQEVINDYDSDILSLSSFANCIDSLFGTKELREKGLIEELTEIRASIDCAVELLLEYDNAKDIDLKDEFGFQYSEIIADIEEMIEELSNQGINLYIH